MSQGAVLTLLVIDLEKHIGKRPDMAHYVP
jgi:hypothetical protein